MSDLNTHLVAVARSLVLSNDELDKIHVSITNLQTKIDGWFEGELISHFQFGSSTRGTILPRRVDENSDIDYMVVFRNPENFKPSTLLEKLKRFVEAKYARSEIHQSHPTIVLELTHIKFELVPAIQPYSLTGIYHIPAPSSQFMEWMQTTPIELKNMIAEADNRYHYQIRRLIRLLKYWNVMNGKVYSSFEIEEYIGSFVFFNCTFLEDYFFQAVEFLPTAHLPHYKLNKVQRLKDTVQTIQTNYYQRGFKNWALSDLSALLPLI